RIPGLTHLDAAALERDVQAHVVEVRIRELEQPLARHALGVGHGEAHPVRRWPEPEDRHVGATSHDASAVTGRAHHTEGELPRLTVAHFDAATYTYTGQVGCKRVHSEGRHLGRDVSAWLSNRLSHAQGRRHARGPLDALEAGRGGGSRR